MSDIYKDQKVSGIGKYLLFLCLTVVASHLVAGDPIQFSTPRRTIKTPAEDPLEAILNRPLDSIKPKTSLSGNPAPDFTLPPPVVIVPKKKESDSENDFNPFLKQQDKLQQGLDYNQFLKNRGDDGIQNRKNISPVEQYLIQQQRQSMLNRQGRDVNSTASRSIDTSNSVFGNESAERTAEQKTGSLYEQIYGKNPFSLYGNSATRREAITGMTPFSRSITGESGFKALPGLQENLQSQRSAKMDEFKKLLGELSINQIPAKNPADAINNFQDLTKKSDNPVSTTPLDKFGGIGQSKQGTSFEDSVRSRPRAGLPEPGGNAGFQNKNTPSERSESPEEERERRKPAPVFTPIPRRPF